MNMLISFTVCRNIHKNTQIRTNKHKYKRYSVKMKIYNNICYIFVVS